VQPDAAASIPELKKVAAAAQRRFESAAVAGNDPARLRRRLARAGGKVRLGPAAHKLLDGLGLGGAAAAAAAGGGGPAAPRGRRQQLIRFAEDGDEDAAEGENPESSRKRKAEGSAAGDEAGPSTQVGLLLGLGGC